MNAESPLAGPLREDGYALFPGVLDQRLLDDLRKTTDALLDAYPAPERERFRYQGSNIRIDERDPVFGRLIACPKTFEVFRSIGFTDPRYWSGFILSKPPHAPSLYWHQDWWAWDSVCSRGKEPQQVFAMFYLTDTRPENGCLRVIPGTHWRRIPLHDQLPAAHTEDTYYSDSTSVLHARHPDEVDVPVKAGDLVVGDARLLHAAHANGSDHRRTCLTLWYFAHYASLPATVRASVTKMAPQHRLVTDPAVLRILTTPYQGRAKGIRFNRIPGRYLAAR
jgi:hypothetical protein